MAPKRAAKKAAPPPPPPAESSDETRSGSRSRSEESEDEEAIAESPVPAATPAPTLTPAPTQNGDASESSGDEEDDDSEEEEEEEEEEEKEDQPAPAAPKNQPPPPQKKEDSDASGSDDDDDEDEEEEEEEPTLAAPPSVPKKQPPQPQKKQDSDTSGSDDDDDEEEAPPPPPAPKETAALKPPAPAAAAEEAKKQGGIQRIWSTDDELRILEALAAYQKQHGAFPQPEALIDALAGKLDNPAYGSKELLSKVKALKHRYVILNKKGEVPSKEHDRRLLELSKVVWEGGDKTITAVAVSNNHGEKGFEEMCELYPYLAEEVKELEAARPGMCKRVFGKMDNDKARAMDEKIKKQRVVQIRVEMRRGDLAKEVTKALVDLVDG